MFTSNKNDVLEKFRIKAHLRSYVKDPIKIDESLLQAAVVKLKKLPYEDADPADAIAKKLVRKAIKSGYYKKNSDLTELGCALLKRKKNHKRKHKSVKRHFIMINQHSPLKAV